MLARKLAEDQGNFGSPGSSGVTTDVLGSDKMRGNSSQPFQISVTITALWE